jgi:hypothetical protein
MMWLDEIIERAREDGHFDNLPYQGQRLPLYTNPLEPAHLRSAHRIVKQSGLTLPWIAERKAIEVDVEKATTAYVRRWRWLRQQPPTRENRQAIDQARDALRRQLDALNKRIRDFNLKAPDAQVHLRQLRAETIIRALERPA